MSLCVCVRMICVRMICVHVCATVHMICVHVCVYDLCVCVCVCVCLKVQEVKELVQGMEGGASSGGAEATPTVSSYSNFHTPLVEPLSL